MTTLRELGEMLIKADETGRKMQYRHRKELSSRYATVSEWNTQPHTTNYFNTSQFEYRLEPKIVKHERWVVLSDHLGCATEEEAREYGGIVKKITWETEE